MPKAGIETRNFTSILTQSEIFVSKIFVDLLITLKVRQLRHSAIASLWLGSWTWTLGKNQPSN